MTQKEWRLCNKCGEMVEGIFCWNCETINIDHITKEIKNYPKPQLTNEYKEVVKQELKKIGYNCVFSDNGESIYVDNNPLADWLDINDIIQIEFMNEMEENEDEEDSIVVLIFDIEEIDDIHKLSRMIDFIENEHFKGK